MTTVVLALTLTLGLAARSLVHRMGAAHDLSAGGVRRASAARLAEIDNSFRAIEDGERGAPRDLWDPDYVVRLVGRDPQQLTEWVRANTVWIPYRGVLRGPIGVLNDRQGNSLDRAFLLATLVTKAGHTVRLAHGEMALEQARALLPRLVNERARFVQEMTLPKPDPLPDIQAVAAQYHLDAAAIEQRLESQRGGFEQMVSQLQARVTDQSQRLMSAISSHEADSEWARRYESTIAALRDHWWVQQQLGTEWIDMDVMGPDDAPDRPLAMANETLTLDQLVGEPLYHEIVVRLVTEQWADGRLSERNAFEQTLRPAELVDKPVVLQLWPVDFVGDTTRRTQSDLRSTVLDERYWTASLLVGRDARGTTAIVRTGDAFEPPRDINPMGSGLGNAIANALAPRPATPQDSVHKELSAVWIEYEIRVPGEEPRKYRRTVFDLIGPAARAATERPPLQLDEKRKLIRALSLMMRTEILPLNCRLAPQFVMHLASQSLLGSRELLRAAAQGQLTPASSVSDSLLDSAAPTISALYTLAVARFSLSQDALSIFIDRPQLFTRHLYAVPSDSAIVLRDATDIVANEVGVGLEQPDAIGVRLAQGVLDTNAESVLQGGSSFSNAGNAFAASRSWLTLAAKDASTSRGLKLSEDVRRQIGADVAAGYTVVAPGGALPNKMEASASWWRIDPATGTALGISANGWGFGPRDEETFLMVTRRMAAREFKKAALRFGSVWLTQYMWCLGTTWGEGTVRRGESLSLSIVTSGDECLHDGNIWVLAAASAVVPLIFFTLRFRYVFAMQAPFRIVAPKVRVTPGRGPNVPREPCPSGSGGASSEGGAKGGPKTEPDPRYAKTDPAPTQPDPQYAKTEPGKTQPDPQYGKTEPGKTQPDPQYANTEPGSASNDGECGCPNSEPPPTARAPELDPAPQTRVAAAKARLDAASAKYEVAGQADLEAMQEFFAYKQKGMAGEPSWSQVEQDRLAANMFEKGIESKAALLEKIGAKRELDNAISEAMRAARDRAKQNQQQGGGSCGSKPAAPDPKMVVGVGGIAGSGK